MTFSGSFSKKIIIIICVARSIELQQTRSKPLQNEFLAYMHSEPETPTNILNVVHLVWTWRWGTIKSLDYPQLLILCTGKRN